jgi:hypothetical protein
MQQIQPIPGTYRLVTETGTHWQVPADWASRPRHQRRSHARWLHRTRPYQGTSWPDQWAETQNQRALALS